MVNKSLIFTAGDIPKPYAAERGRVLSLAFHAAMVASVAHDAINDGLDPKVAYERAFAHLFHHVKRSTQAAMTPPPRFV